MSQRSVIQQCKSCWSQGPYRYCWYWCAVPPLIPGTPITMADSPESTMTILMLVVLTKFSGPFFWFLLIWSHLGSQPGQILPYLAGTAIQVAQILEILNFWWTSLPGPRDPTFLLQPSLYLVWSWQEPGIKIPAESDLVIFSNQPCGKMEGRFSF